MKPGPSFARGLSITLLALALAPPAARAQTFELYDTFSIALEGSWVGLGTTIRVDSKTLGKGTELDLENDLKLGDNKTIPSLSLEWRPWQRHRFGAFWKEIDRSSTAQSLEEIRFEDEIIPIGADVALGFDITEFGVAYTYILRPRERSSFGFGGGLRVLRLKTTLLARLEGEETAREWSSDANVTGPLPFVGVEFRHMFSEKVRFQSDVGLFYIKIGDVEGGQALLRASFEHLTFTNVGFGLGIGGSTVRLKSEDDSWLGKANLDIVDVRAFARVRF
jgi:hypothetical protein